MSIKDRLTQSGSNLAEKRKQYESMLGEVKALKEVIEQKEDECTALEAELSKSQDPQVALTEELTQQSSQLVRRVGLYYNAVESGALQEGAAQKDHRLILVYRDEKDLRESLEQAHNKAQYREGQRKLLKEKLSLEIIVAKERIGEQINTAVICPVNVKDYRDYVCQQKGIYKSVDKPGEFAELLLNWIATSFVQAKVQPQSGEYQGFWKATIPGTPQLKFNSELPDAFKEASIDVETVVLGEKEFVLGGEAVVPAATALEIAGEYTLPNGMKVDPSEKYTTGETAAFLGYAGGSSVLYVIESADERKKKGLPLLAGEVQYPGGDTTRRKKTLITGQSIIDFDQQLKGKSKTEITVSPAESVDEVIQPEVSVAGDKAVVRNIIVPNQETFTIAEIAVVLGVGYSCVGDFVKNHPLSEQWKVKGQSKTGYVFKNIPRAMVEKFAEKYCSHHRRKVSQVTIDSSLIGVVEASRYLADKLKECGVEYALSSIGMGTPARTYANKYLNHQPGLKLPAERGEKNRILVRRESLDDFVDEYVKEEVIKPKVRAGKSYDEITATLPDKYHASVNAFIAYRSRGGYKKSGKKAGEEPAGKVIKPVAEDKDYLTTSEAAAIMGVSSRMIQKYITNGKIIAERQFPNNPKSALLIDRASFDDYLVSTGKKAAAVPATVPVSSSIETKVGITSVEVPAVPVASVPTPMEQPAKPSLPDGELERRYQAIKLTLGENYASRIKAVTNGNIGDIEQKAFDESYLPLLSRVWSKIKEMHPGGIIPDDFSPLCRSSTFGNPERLARLETRVNLHYSKFTAQNADRLQAEKEVVNKVDLIRMYTELDEEQAKALIPNLEPDGGIERIDALEKALTGVTKSKATEAATKILQTNVGILIANFDFETYRTKLASTLENISSEYTDEVPEFYNPLKTPQNFTDVGALENVDRALRRAISKKGRSVGSVAVSPDRDYYTQYASGTAKAVEDDGFNLGMVCAIVDHGINIRGRKGFAGKAMSAEVLRKKVSGFYNGKFDGRVYENNLRSMVTCGAMLEQSKFGKPVYSLSIKLSDSVPASLREVLQPFYNNG